MMLTRHLVKNIEDPTQYLVYLPSERVLVKIRVRTLMSSILTLLSVVFYDFSPEIY